MNDVLKELLDRYQHLSDYGETKLGALAAFNTAMAIGLLSIFKDQNKPMQYYILWIIAMTLISLFFVFSGLFAKRKNTHEPKKNTEPKNYLYYKYIANLKTEDFIRGIESDYKLNLVNKALTHDTGNQIVVLASIADRKFTNFNIAIGFTIMGIFTPLGLIYFLVFSNKDW